MSNMATRLKKVAADADDEKRVASRKAFEKYLPKLMHQLETAAARGETSFDIDRYSGCMKWIDPLREWAEREGFKLECFPTDKNGWDPYEALPVGNPIMFVLHWGKR